MKSKWLTLVVLCACQPTAEKINSSSALFSLLPPSRTGIHFKNLVTETPSKNHIVNESFISGAGIGVGDINNDGLPDLFFTGNQVQDRLYLNQGGMLFEDITDEAGILTEKVWSTGVTMGDVNNDGYLDIYVCKYDFREGEFGKNLLYINNGDLTFAEMASEYGLNHWGLSIQATFFDFDKDGHLDLYLVNQPNTMGFTVAHGIPVSALPKVEQHTDRMFKNMGNGKFRDVTDSCGIRNLAYGLAASVGDFNNDQLPDIYVANDYEEPDHLYINQGDGNFENRIHQSMKHISFFSMGTDIADYDNDGFLDLIVLDMIAEDNKRIKTNQGGMDPEVFWDNVSQGRHYQYMFNTLQHNNGNGTFTDLAHLAGVSNTDWSWSGLFADFDNDGWKDLFVTNGVRRAMRNSDFAFQYDKILDDIEIRARETGKQPWELLDFRKVIEMAPIEKLPNFIFKNNGDLTFTKKTKEWGMNLPTLSNGAAYADLDLDGDLELIVNNIDDYAHVYQNNSLTSENGNFLRVFVADDHGSPAYGSRVKIFKNGEFWQLQELTNARGFLSKSEDILHFGLGKTEWVERVVITWPNGNELIKENVKANQLLTFNPGASNKKDRNEKKLPGLFREITQNLNIDYVHQENDYDDFRKEVLLPHKMSNLGPGLAVGDANNDGREDFYVGGAAGFPGALFLQQENSSFVRSAQEVWETDKKFEDLGALFFDADNDGDLDLYVVSGGNDFEPGSEALQDRLYVNDGAGTFSRARRALPEMLTSGSVVVPGDYDKDGDLDLFIGGRLVPGQYPRPARSHILRNDGGRFEDVTDSVAPDLLTAGLVTTAVWTDFSGDGDLDLALSGEWMPVTLMVNKQGKFENVTGKAGLENTTGWYYSLVSHDFDNDGDQDFVAGNLGLNYKYKASEEEPFEVYSHDFDGNGSLDIVLGYHEQGELYPLRGRSCSSDQIPLIAQRFPTFEAFGEANLRDVYGEGLDKALNYKARTFASSFVENLGDGTFRVRNLPNQAQVSNINNIVVYDFNQDSNLDLLISGNLYPAEIETPRNDAGTGLYLEGDGKGNFRAVPLTKSGFFAPHDAKDMALLTLGKGRDEKLIIVVANNQERLQAILYNPQAISEDQLLSLK